VKNDPVKDVFDSPESMFRIFNSHPADNPVNLVSLLIKLSKIAASCRYTGDQSFFICLLRKRKLRPLNVGDAKQTTR
jgi:hypothetical protein